MEYTNIKYLENGTRMSIETTAEKGLKMLAAEDMYEALKFLVKWVEDESSPDELVAFIADKVEKALSKAQPLTGEEK